MSGIVLGAPVARAVDEPDGEPEQVQALLAFLRGWLVT